jgi:uncharacterized coiled-coil protein SlyX
MANKRDRREGGEDQTPVPEAEASSAQLREYAETTVAGMRQALEAFKRAVELAANSASLMGKAERLFAKAEQKINGLASTIQIDNVKDGFVANLSGLKDNVLENNESNRDESINNPDVLTLKKSISVNEVLTEEERNNFLGDIKPDMDQASLEALGARFFVLAQEKYKNKMQSYYDSFISSRPTLKDRVAQTFIKYSRDLSVQTTVFGMRNIFARFEEVLRDYSSASPSSPDSQESGNSLLAQKLTPDNILASVENNQPIYVKVHVDGGDLETDWFVENINIDTQKVFVSKKNGDDISSKWFDVDDLLKWDLEVDESNHGDTPESEPSSEDISKEKTELIKKAAEELDATSDSLRADDYGINAEKAADLVSGSIEKIQNLDHNLTINELNQAITEINSSLDVNLEALKVSLIDPKEVPSGAAEEPVETPVPEDPVLSTEQTPEVQQEKLKLVDIKPEKIKEILESANVVAQLKDLLLQKEGAGSAGLQESIVEVLQNYFTEQNLNLNSEAQENLKAMIENLAAETSEQVTQAFASSLEQQAKIDSGWFDKVKQHMSALMGARLATTFAIGIGATALAPVIAPMLGMAAVGWGTVGLAGGIAGLGRYFGNKIFTKFQKSEKNINKLKSKEEEKIEQRKAVLLEENFINVDSLAAVMANTLRTSTSEDFRTGQILDSEGNFSEEVAETLKANIQNLLDNDPRYVGLSPEEKILKAKQLFTYFVHGAYSAK